MSLSISDGGAADEAIESTPSLLDTSLWFPSFPTPDLSFLGIDPRGVRVRDRDPKMAIKMALFGTKPGSLTRVSGIAVRTRSGTCIDNVEICYSDGAAPVRIQPGDTQRHLEPHMRSHNTASRFAIDYANGEYIVGVKVFYAREGCLLGFVVCPLAPFSP